MGNRFTTIRRHDGESAPGLDLSRVIVIGFLIAAALGLMTYNVHEMLSSRHPF